MQIRHLQIQTRKHVVTKTYFDDFFHTRFEDVLEDEKQLC